MRRVEGFVGALALLAAVALSGCAMDSGDEPGDDTRNIEGTAQTLTAARSGRLFVFQLRDGALETVRTEVLDHAPRAPRHAPAAWSGRYEVLDGAGAVLAEGAFRLPTRVHALYAAVDGSAEPADVALKEPVFWLRAPTPAGSTRLRVWQREADARDTLLGEVTL